MNPIKKIRNDKDLTVNKYAKLLDSNSLTIKSVEEGNCLNTTYFTIIRKISLKFDNIADGKLLKEYEKWLDTDNN